MEIKTWPDLPFWEELVEQSPESTFYHTPLWHNIVADSFKSFSIATMGFIFEDGTHAVLPFIRTKAGTFLKSKHRLKSSVCGGYGGIISDKKLSQDQQAQIYNHLKQSKASISIDCNPFSDYTLPDFFQKKKDFVHVISLDGDEEAIYKTFSRNAKRGLKQALKQGVIVRTARSESDITAYYTIYRDALRRWGDSAQHVYPEALFINLFQQGGSGVKMWIAEKEEKIIAMITMLYLNRIVTGWHGVALEKYFDCCPNNILHMEIIRDAFKNNYRYYDFGPSGGLEGVISFKESFGTERRSFDSGHWKKRWGTVKQP
jgi:hypothetical protein